MILTNRLAKVDQSILSRKKPKRSEQIGHGHIMGTVNVDTDNVVDIFFFKSIGEDVGGC